MYKFLFICFLYCSKKDPVVENVETDVATYHYHHEKMVEKKTINFLLSPYYTMLFSRKENIKFLEVVLVAALCYCLISCFMIA